MSALLEIRNLRIDFHLHSSGTVPVLRNANLLLGEGEAVGIFGESGSGKTTLAHAILGLLTSEYCDITGALRFRGEDVLTMSRRRFLELRGSTISLVPQEPSVALNPVATAEAQVAEVIYAHRPISIRSSKMEARAWLGKLFPIDVERIARSYPHQMSGGERQRVVIAQAICCNPSLLIADEPTSSLDSITQYEILRELRQLREQRKMALLFFSHNRGALSFITQQTLELRDGRLIS